MERIQDFEGLQYPFSTEPVARRHYDANNVEYATSSHKIDHDMFPGLIVLPQGDKDVQNAVRYAKQNGYPVSVMSGGHQYSGACSTHGKGIQINLRRTYKGPQDLLVLPAMPAPDENRVLVYASVSTSLGEFNKFLATNKLFVPHGQCTDVYLGGHAQTGGYGQLARSFGLLGDHVRGIRLVDHAGEIKEVTKGSDPELFHALLGGSPGNFGVVTHYTIEAHRDQDHDFPESNARPHGFKAIWLYNKTVLTALLTEIATMSSEPDFPRNFDLCVSVLSSSFPMFKLVPELKENLTEILQRITDALGENGDVRWPCSVVLYAQWVPMGPEDKYTPAVDAWFARLRALDSFWKHWCIFARDLVQPMSQMTGEWLFTRAREFDHPYVKRAYATNSTSLATDGWVEAVVERIDRVLVPWHDLALWDHCFLSVQIQCYGGKNSKFVTNADNGTAYSWRDSTLLQTLDCFHLEGERGKALADEWQAGNDGLMIGPKSPFSKQDKRVLWASYGDWDLDKSWPAYYDDEAKYQRLGRQRYRADPDGTFTPNPFCVKAIKG